MHDKHKVKGHAAAYAVKYKHGLNGEMPWTGSVGGRHYNGYAAHDERYKN